MSIVQMLFENKTSCFLVAYLTKQVSILKIHVYLTIVTYFHGYYFITLYSMKIVKLDIIDYLFINLYFANTTHTSQALRLLKINTFTTILRHPYNSKLHI